MMTTDAVSPDTIELPDDLVEGLRACLGYFDAHQWMVGDYLVDAVDELAPVYGRALFPERPPEVAAKKARAWMVRKLAGKVGADPATLRDREVMARFYPPKIRKKYDALTYHQLRACKSAKEAWRKWADWALQNLPAPPNLIRGMIKHEGELPPAWIGRWNRLVSIADSLSGDREAPAQVRLFSRLLGYIEDEREYQ